MNKILVNLVQLNKLCKSKNITLDEVVKILEFEATKTNQIYMTISHISHAIDKYREKPKV